MINGNTALGGILQSAHEDGDWVSISREDYHVLKLYAEAKFPGNQDSVNAPHEYKDALVRYVQGAVYPGDFLYGLLTQDLKMVMGHADGTSLFYLQAIYKYAYNVIPSMCFGSKAVVDNFLQSSGLPKFEPKY